MKISSWIILVSNIFLLATSLCAAEPYGTVYSTGVSAIEKILSRQKWLKEQIEILSKKDSVSAAERMLIEKEADELRKLLEKDVNSDVWLEAAKSAYALKALEAEVENERRYAQENYATLKSAFVFCGLLSVAGAVVFANWFVGIKKERDIYFGIPR
jgi:hypothetical protein